LSYRHSVWGMEKGPDRWIKRAKGDKRKDKSIVSLHSLDTGMGQMISGGRNFGGEELARDFDACRDAWEGRENGRGLATTVG